MALGSPVGHRRDALRRRPERGEARRAGDAEPGSNIVAPTGLHHERFYGPVALESPDRRSRTLPTSSPPTSREGIDRNDYAGPVVHRAAQRAGVIKVAGSGGGPSARDRLVFAAAAEAHRRTGAPILTHCEAGTGALEQIEPSDGSRRACPAHHAQPRRQGRRPRLPPRDRLARARSSSTTRSWRWGDAAEWNDPGCCAGWWRTTCLDHVVVGNGRRPAAVLQGLRWIARARLAARQPHRAAWARPVIDAGDPRAASSSIIQPARSRSRRREADR